MIYGIPGDSLLYRDYFSIRSDDELEIGMEVEIIQHEKEHYIFNKESSCLFVR